MYHKCDTSQVALTKSTQAIFWFRFFYGIFELLLFSLFSSGSIFQILGSKHTIVSVHCKRNLLEVHQNEKYYVEILEIMWKYYIKNTQEMSDVKILVT